MATEYPGLSRTYGASADLSTKQYFQMKRHTTAHQVALAAAVTDVIVGTLQNKPAAAGRGAEVMCLGFSKVEVEATTDIAVGDKLGPHTDGRLIKKTADKDNINATAEEGATSATGDRIMAMIFPTCWLGA